MGTIFKFKSGINQEIFGAWLFDEKLLKNDFNFI